MAKKVLSILLAVMMIAALCTVAFVSTSAAAMANVTFNGETKVVKVGDEFTVKMIADMPEGYAAQGGQFEISYDPAKVEIVPSTFDDEPSNFYSDLGSVIAESNPSPERLNFVPAATRYNAKNRLSGDKNVFAAFTFKVLVADDITITENTGVKDFAVFQDGNTTPIEIIKGGETVGAVDGLTVAVVFDAPTYTQANMDALNAAIAKAEEILADAEGNYTEDTIDALQAAVDAAKEVAAQDPYDAKQADVDAAAAAIDAAINGLKKIINTKEELQALVDSTNADIVPNEADYTEESFAALQAALEAAQAVLDDEDATVEDIINAAAALEAAIDGLEKITTPDETTPDETTPDETTPDETTPDETTPDGTTPDKDGTVPGTGEGTMTVFALLAVLAMAGVAVVVARKRATK